MPLSTPPGEGEGSSPEIKSFLVICCHLLLAIRDSKISAEKKLLQGLQVGSVNISETIFLKHMVMSTLVDIDLHVPDT